MVAAELDLAHADPHHELMLRIRAHIDANLPSADITPARIAAEHVISTRHLHGVFQEQGATVAGWIRTQRLEHCHRDLFDPAQAGGPSRPSPRAGASSTPRTSAGCSRPRSATRRASCARQYLSATT